MSVTSATVETPATSAEKRVALLAREIGQCSYDEMTKLALLFAPWRLRDLYESERDYLYLELAAQFAPKSTSDNKPKSNGELKGSSERHRAALIETKINRYMAGQWRFDRGRATPEFPVNRTLHRLLTLIETRKAMAPKAAELDVETIRKLLAGKC